MLVDWGLQVQIYIEFSGGPLDGRAIVADSESDESDTARALYRMSESGAIGKQFSFLPPEAARAIRDLGWEEALASGHEVMPVCYEVAACGRFPDSTTVHVVHVDTRPIRLMQELLLENEGV